MQTIRKIILIMFLFVSTDVFAQLYESIQAEATNILLDLSKHQIRTKIDFKKLNLFLSDAISSDKLEIKYQTSLQEVDSLKNHLQLFLSEFDKISTDSALYLFNQWYLHLSNTFYNYADEKFFSSEKEKILFFSTSVSCHCTLEMCKNQTIEILNLARENNLDYWIVDSFEHNELQIKYETLFAPSLLVFNGNNEVVLKIEYEEKMLEMLLAYFNGKDKSKD